MINLASSGIEIMPYIENKNLEAIDKIKKKSYRNLLIPKVINSMYPKMKYEDYQILKKDSIFNAKVAYICDSCFLDLTRYCNFLGSNTDNFLKTIRPNLSNVRSKYNLSGQNNLKSARESHIYIDKSRTKSTDEFKLRNFGKGALNSDLKLGTYKELGKDDDSRGSAAFNEKVFGRSQTNSESGSKFGSLFRTANMSEIKKIIY